jgi:hypothetical protein
MAMVLKSEFLKSFVLQRLTDTNTLPVGLPPSSALLQVIQVNPPPPDLPNKFTYYREKGETDKSIQGVLSDQYTRINAQFSAECCNEFEAYSKCPAWLT